MELVYKIEKNEKEMVELLLRRHTFLKELCDFSICMAILWHLAFVFGWFGFSCADKYGTGSIIALLGTSLFCLCALALHKIIVSTPIRSFRQRKTHSVEYVLTGKDGAYDYNKIAGNRIVGENGCPLEADTEKYAFRLDGKPTVFAKAAVGASVDR